MYFLMLEIADPKYKEDVFLALQSVGIERASSIDSSDISGELSDELTFFSGFFRSDKMEKHQQLIVLALIRTKEQAKELLDNLREGGANIDKEDILSLALMPAVMSFNSEHGFFEEKE